MKKKSLVWGLFRSKRDERMTQFFSNNFTEDRWRKAALKNAFALLGKQRFEHAAAFFLLAGALRDAIEVKIYIIFYACQPYTSFIDFISSDSVIFYLILILWSCFL